MRLSYNRTIPWEVEQSEFMRLTQRQDAIIVGSLLGDGCLERNGRNVRLRLEHGKDQKSYLVWKFKELKSVITGSVMKVHAYHKMSNRFYDSYRAYTFSNEAMQSYQDRFYLNSKKIIPGNICELLKNPLSLAVWFMDDGYKRNDCNAFRLGTDSFNLEEQKLLQNVLKMNFGIETKMHKKGKYWNIYIPERESKKFVRIIKPYIIPKLKYKIALTP